MSDSYLTILAAIMAALKADAALTALVSTRIYGDVPDNPTFPFVVCYITSSPFDTKTSSGMQHILQVQGFSRKPSPHEVGQIRAAVYNVLHKQEAAFAASGVSDIIFTGAAPVFKESDGQTWNCPAQYRLTVG